MASTILPKGHYYIETTSKAQYDYEVDRIVIDTIGDIVALYSGEEPTVVMNWSTIEAIISKRCVSVREFLHE